jgi:hypothetical protein
MSELSHSICQQVQLLLHGLCKLLQLLPGRSINLAVSSPI